MEFKKFIYLVFVFVLDRESVSREERPRGGRERQRERESQAGSTLSAEPDVGLHPTTLGSWPELKSRYGRSTNWATQVPPSLLVRTSVILYLGPTQMTSFSLNYLFKYLISKYSHSRGESFNIWILEETQFSLNTPLPWSLPNPSKPPPPLLLNTVQFDMRASVLTSMGYSVSISWLTHLRVCFMSHLDTKMSKNLTAINYLLIETHSFHQGCS